MKDVSGVIRYRDRDYKLVFNINVMEALQEEYGTLDKWGELTDGSKGEPNAKAIKFGFMQMLNEGIEIENDENGTNNPLLTLKQVGRMITEYGLDNITSVMNETVIESSKSAEKNL